MAKNNMFTRFYGGEGTDYNILCIGIVPHRNIEQKVKERNGKGITTAHADYCKILQLIGQAAEQGINIYPTFVEYTMYKGKDAENTDNIDDKYPYYDINILEEIPSELKNKFDVIIFGDSVVKYIVDGSVEATNAKKDELLEKNENVLKYLLGHQFTQLFKESSKLQMIYDICNELADSMGSDNVKLKKCFDTEYGVGYCALPLGIYSSKLFKIFDIVFNPPHNLRYPRVFAKINVNPDIKDYVLVYIKELMDAVKRGEF